LQKKCTRVHTLIRTDTRAIGDDQNEIRVFMTVRDEILRLPRTFEHYRKIGVTRFFVVDNESTDGSKEFLLAQPDCHVFMTRNSYAESLYGVEWYNALLNEYGVNHWCLIVDADEWFVYPGYENRTLSDFAAYLDRSAAQGVFAFLLDMYGPGTIAESISEPQRSLLDACRYFDSEYEWHRRSHVGAPCFPEYQVFGGPRFRLFFPNLRRYHYFMRVAWRGFDLVRLPLPVALRPPPRLTKIPFFRWLPGTSYHLHQTTPITLSETTGVLLHFKFLQDFYARVVSEVRRKEHWDGASEYSRYLAKLKNNPSLTFHYEGSVRYEGSEQLIRLGLLKEDGAWWQMRARADDTTAENTHHSGTQPAYGPFVTT